MVLSTSCAKCGSNNDKIFKEKFWNIKDSGYQWQHKWVKYLVLDVKSIHKLKIQTFLVCLTEVLFPAHCYECSSKKNRFMKEKGS